MDPLILHHFAASPFSEKLRLVLGYKRLAWKSVLVPAVMPKPDVVALTGGYRRTPVLQIGADIYCDTALICDVLERLQPAPSLYPEPLRALSRVVGQWADRRFRRCTSRRWLRPSPPLIAGGPDWLRGPHLAVKATAGADPAIPWRRSLHGSKNHVNERLLGASGRHWDRCGFRTFGPVPKSRASTSSATSACEGPLSREALAGQGRTTTHRQVTAAAWRAESALGG